MSGEPSGVACPARDASFLLPWPMQLPWEISRNRRDTKSVCRVHWNTSLDLHSRFIHSCVVNIGGIHRKCEERNSGRRRISDFGLRQAVGTRGGNLRARSCQGTPTCRDTGRGMGFSLGGVDRRTRLRSFAVWRARWSGVLCVSASLRACTFGSGRSSG